MKKALLIVSGIVCIGFGVERARAYQEHHRIVCGTNEGNQIYCATYEGMEHGRWERLPGELKQVVVRENQVWGVNASGEIYYSADLRNPHWVKLTGRAKEVSEGHGVLCLVNDHDEIYCADRGITTASPEWRKAPDGARLKFISVD